jgi:hypothetical protein
MLTTWDENSTWNGLGNGLTRDDIESLAVRDAVLLNPGADETFQTVTGPGLATAVQSWVNGAPNFGWFIHNTTAGGLDLSASEGVIPANRPQLVVSYIPPAGAGSFEFEEPVFTTTEGGTAATITVARVGGTAGAVSVNFATGGGTAIAGTDYTTASGTLNFAAGEIRKTFTVNITNDTAVEPLETINLALSSPTGGATLGARSSATLRLKDNDVDPALRLNELLTNPPDRDEPFEFVETIGTPGSALGNIYFAAIEGDAGIGAGLADQVIDVTSVLQGANGLSVIKALLGGHTILPGATVVPESRFDTTGGNILEPGTTSFVLIHSPTAVITQGTDYDWNGDGTLELPAGATIIDGVGVTDGGTGDIIYAAANLTIGTNNTPDGMTRIRGNTAANNATAWYFADLSSGASSSLAYNPAAAGPNLPAGAILTPGNPNYRVAVPLVQNVIVDDDSVQRSVVRNIRVVFDGVVTFVGPEADAFSLVRTGGLPAGVTLTVTPANVSGVTVATLTFSGSETEPNTAPGVNPSLVDGLYTLTVRGDKVQNATGFLDGDANGAPGGDYVSPPPTPTGGPGQPRLFRLFGDGTGNGLVDLTDLALLRSTFNASLGDPAFSSYFDTEGNGVVDLLDLAAFRTRFNFNLFP